VVGEEQRQVEDHPDHGGGDGGQRRGELQSPCVASTSGPPARMNRNDGRKVKKVTTVAPPRRPGTGVRPEHLLGQPPTKADEGHHHDQRPRRGFAQRQAVDHLRAVSQP
jgi:hypothetical protein